MRGRGREEFEADHRHFLYREYLQILAEHYPPVFVLENVKGILSSTIGQTSIFEQILNDLRTPAVAVGLESARTLEYRLFSIAPGKALDASEILRPTDLIIRTEDVGLPQARHRVIVVGAQCACYC